MAKAELLQDLGANGVGAWQKHYQLSEPLKGYGWGDDVPPAEYEYVIVSAVNAPFSGPETYIFGANAAGQTVDWGELPGSYRGSKNHEEALRRAGYEVV